MFKIFVETALKNVGSIPRSRPFPLSGDQNVFVHSLPDSRKRAIKEILLTYLALETLGNYP
jgi:hypothetical protein